MNNSFFRATIDTLRSIRYDWPSIHIDQPYRNLCQRLDRIDSYRALFISNLIELTNKGILR